MKAMRTNFAGACPPSRNGVILAENGQNKTAASCPPVEHHFWKGLSRTKVDIVCGMYSSKSGDYGVCSIGIPKRTLKSNSSGTVSHIGGNAVRSSEH